MSGDFPDTNLLVCLFDDASERRRGIASSVVSSALESGDGIISSQVVQETLNVVTGKFRATRAEANLLLESTLAPLWRGSQSVELYQRALELQVRYKYHFYDSLILVAALVGGCDRLLSEDFQHGQTIDGLTVHNPFL